MALIDDGRALVVDTAVFLHPAHASGGDIGLLPGNIGIAQARQDLGHGQLLIAGQGQVLPFPLFIAAVGGFSIWFAGLATKRGWIAA